VYPVSQRSPAVPCRRAPIAPVVIAIATLAAACSAPPKREGKRVGAATTGDVQHGLATWYGRGRGTASGERFDRRAMTAAHRTLPFHTRVRVTNRHNGRSVIVRINDRGPFVRGRIIDVSEAAAEALGMKRAGVVPVKVERLR
jgi:rare lipoprotein A